MLLYESAKCLHGRPRKFKGRFYSSIFTHYKPSDWDIDIDVARGVVPAIWMEGSKFLTDKSFEDEVFPKLRMQGTGFSMTNDNNCLHNWCGIPDVVESKYGEFTKTLKEVGKGGVDRSEVDGKEEL